MFCTQKPSAVPHPELGSVLSLPCREAKSPRSRLKCLPTLVSSAQHQTGFALHINDMGQQGQQHCPLLPTSPTPQKPAVPWRHCPALAANKCPVPKLLAGPTWPLRAHAAAAKEPFSFGWPSPALLQPWLASLCSRRSPSTHSNLISFEDTLELNMPL